MFCVFRFLGWISVLIIAILSLVPGAMRPHLIETELLFGLIKTGKIEHVIAYAGTAALLAVGYGAKQKIATISVFLPVYAAFLETLQIWVPGRTAQITDVFASTIGAWIGIALALWLLKTLPTHKVP